MSRVASIYMQIHTLSLFERETETQKPRQVDRTDPSKSLAGPLLGA